MSSKNRIVVVRGTGPQWNPQWFTPKRCAEIQARNPVAFQTDVLGEFADPESGWLSPVLVAKYTREGPFEVPWSSRGRYTAALDTAGGSSTGNPWCLVIVDTVQIVEEGSTTLGNGYKVVAVREWRGLDPEATWGEVATALEAFHLRQVYIDQYAAAQNVALARQVGVTALAVAWSATNKVEAFTNVATLVHSDHVELHPDRQFQRDILSVKKRTKANGFEIRLPTTSDGRHADYAPAFVMAVSNATTYFDHSAFCELQRRRAARAPLSMADHLGISRRARLGVLDQLPEQRAFTTFPYSLPSGRGGRGSF